MTDPQAHSSRLGRGVSSTRTTDAALLWRRLANRLIALLPAKIVPLVDEPLRRPELSIELAWMEVIQNYRRTVLGPVWITLNLVIIVFAMTIVYGALFGVPSREYAAFLTAGLIIWFYVSALLTEMGNTFINYAHFVKNTSINKAILIWATVWKQVIIMAHHLVVYFLLLLLGVIKLSVYSLLAIPALIILVLASVPIAVVMSILFPRFRDISRLIGSTMTVLMMVTPIFWQPGMVTGWRSLIFYLNPIYYFVEFVRKPLLGQPPDPLVVVIVLAMTATAWFVGAEAYRRYSRYIVFWL